MKLGSLVRIKGSDDLRIKSLAGKIGVYLGNGKRPGLHTVLIGGEKKYFAHPEESFTIVA